MTYAHGETNIKALIQTIPAFSAGTVTRKNWRVMNQGKASCYAVLKKGSFTRSYQAKTLVITTWSTLCEVWQRYKDETVSANDLDDRCQDVIDKIDVYRLLNDDEDEILDAKVSRGDAPQEVWLNGGAGPAWLMATLTIEWKEEQEITFAE